MTSDNNKIATPEPMPQDLKEMSGQGEGEEALQPGKRLDLEIARAVIKLPGLALYRRHLFKSSFGQTWAWLAEWQFKPGHYWHQHKDLIVRVDQGEDAQMWGWWDADCILAPHHIPTYSTDIAQAWQVVERMAYLLGHQRHTDTGRRFLETVRQMNLFVQDAQDAAHQICLAALKAVGYFDTEKVEK